MPDAFRIARLVVDRVVAAHGDDIALVAYYGSCGSAVGGICQIIRARAVGDQKELGRLCFTNTGKT